MLTRLEQKQEQLADDVASLKHGMELLLRRSQMDEGLRTPDAVGSAASAPAPAAPDERPAPPARPSLAKGRSSLVSTEI